jgi:serine/threonine-protein kinase HipA
MDGWTREIIRLLPPLRTPPAMIDLGCGRGYQTIALADHFQAKIVAVDETPRIIDQLVEAAAAAGVSELILPRLGSLADLPDAVHSYDLIWSENGVRRIGLEKALALWTPLLRNRGVMVIGDCSWVEPNPPEEAAVFWRRAYPGMTDTASIHAAARRAGLRVYDTYAFPKSVWRTDYFEPLARRVARRRSEGPLDTETEEAIRAAEAEITMFDRWGDRFQFAFHLLRLS